MRKTNLYIEERKMPDGAIRIEVSTQAEYNLKYESNTWWAKTKDYLKKNGII
jgi:hypothetical protein